MVKVEAGAVLHRPFDDYCYKWSASILRRFTAILRFGGLYASQSTVPVMGGQHFDCFTATSIRAPAQIGVFAEKNGYLVQTLSRRPASPVA